MKYILIFLLSFPAMADILPPDFPAGTIVRNNSIIEVRILGGCWWVDAKEYERIPTTETSIFEVVNQNMDGTKPCGWKPGWVTYSQSTCGSTRDQQCETSPLYDSGLYESEGKFKSIGRVKRGTPCEVAAVRKSVGDREWHHTTNADGLRGLAVCEVQN